MSLLLGVLAEWWPALAALGAAAMAYLTGRRSGHRAAENKALRETQRRVEKGRQNVEDIHGADRRERIERLRDKWE